MNVVPDTSVVVDGRVSEQVDDGTFEDETVYIPRVVVDELESQANRGKETGWDGLDELERLVDHAADDRIELEYVDSRPDGSTYRGLNDVIIRSVAADYDAQLLTSDVVQSRVAKATGVSVEYTAPKTREPERLGIKEFFDDQTLSVHLKADVEPMAKRGDVGDMHYQPIRKSIATEDELKGYAHEIIQAARGRADAFVELDEDGMQIVQYGPLRIAISRPPFSNGWEITAVRALVQTSLEDYAHAAELEDRLLERQRGVLVAGSPGAGKSTFAQAIASFLSDNDFVVKTMEKPRDLQVGPEITQYTALSGQMEKTADALLMVRPDYTIYDEIRKTADFSVFADMRLAGVGMIGVVHATRAIDAIQRLVGRVELGMIPQVVDTVVYIEDGQIETVYDITIDVKLPEGMTAADLARPVVSVRDFESGRPEYELYLFSRQVVTVPIGAEEVERESGMNRLAKGEIEREIRSIARGRVDVEIAGMDRATVYVDERDISAVIGKQGERISSIEDRLGIDIDVRTHDEKSSSTPVETVRKERALDVVPEFTRHHVVLSLDADVGETVEVEADGEYLFTATVGRGGEIQLSRGTAVAEELERAIDDGRPIIAVHADE
ncbi:PINc/VapC family ATPase [Natronococcus wangiae]|uniref:PINc/VapC family ATPase n=1 Tax=Natronococcus wangiae TaxID=3068275 RepID=UPI0027400D3D|nr:PINc/VapC family ATPase [Natronococcus sp. AD5]